MISFCTTSCFVQIFYSAFVLIHFQSVFCMQFHTHVEHVKIVLYISTRISLFIMNVLLVLSFQNAKNVIFNDTTCTETYNSLNVVYVLALSWASIWFLKFPYISAILDFSSIGLHFCREESGSTFIQTIRNLLLDLLGLRFAWGWLWTSATNQRTIIFKPDFTV
jgi:hypothetical protein